MIEMAFFDSTMGLKPQRNVESFNNIIYTTQYAIGEKVTDNSLRFAKTNLFTHIGANQDIYGLYIPKASHDNSTYLILATYQFDMPYYRKKIKFLPLIWNTGLFRPWDTALYAYLLAPKPLKWLLTPITLLPTLQSLYSAYKGVKTRPIWYERLDNVLQFPVKIKTEPIFAGYAETYRRKDGKEFTLRHLQNDGTHLAAFKFYTLKKENFIFGLGAKICDYILERKYGKRYIAHIVNNYFPEQDHPVRQVFSETDNFILK